MSISHSKLGVGGIPIPPLRTETEATPPSDHVRDLVRQSQADRQEFQSECRSRIDTFGLSVTETRRVADNALAVANDSLKETKSFGWKLNIILGGVATTFMMVAAIAAWTLTRVDTIERDVRSRSEEDARRAAHDAFTEERKSLREELANDRKDTVRELLAEQRKLGLNPDVLTASK